MVGHKCLMADVCDPLPDTPGDTGKKASLKPPVREKDERLLLGRLMWKPITKEIPRQKVGLDPAKLTGEKVIRLLKSSRSPALGALVFDQEF